MVPGKKKMLLSYLPARLVIPKNKKQAWYILYYQTDPSTGEKERFRETFDINRVKCLKTRKKLAQKLIEDINGKLPTGFPYDNSYLHQLQQTNIIEAVETARDLKINDTDRGGSINNYSSKTNIFVEWLTSKKLNHLSVNNFTDYHRQAFLDYLKLDRKVGGTTYNNYLNVLRAMFNELKDRKYITLNHFSAQKRMREAAKRRRAFSQIEKKVMADYVKVKDKELMLSIWLQYHCFIRPQAEMRRLKGRHIIISENVIRIEGELTKNRQDAIITIPDSLLPNLKKYSFPANHFVFGKKLKPSIEKPCGKNEMNNRHKAILQHLHKKGDLENINGLMHYSWKDTGAYELFKRGVNILEIMRQLRHKDLSTTQKYCESLYIINKQIKKLDNIL